MKKKEVRAQAEQEEIPAPAPLQPPQADAGEDAKIVELESAVASLKDQLLRKVAEFENYKKRIENDFASLARFSNEELILQLLPILDDLSRSLKAGKEQPEFETFYRGVELIYTKFMRILQTQGVKEIDSVGKPFDVYYHDAMMEMPRTDVPHHTIVEEVEKGYELHGKVIRHAKVILAAEPSPSTQNGDNPADPGQPNPGNHE
jgi:molecular chaperone GrpE